MNEMQPSADNPFALLGLPAAYRVGNAQIERAYLGKLACTHPDRVGDAQATDAAMINDARAALLNPERRANALLVVLGGRSSSADNTLPEGFLMEIMMRRQEIEEELESNAEPAREHWRAWGNEERARYSDEAASLFDTIIAGGQEEGQEDARDQCRAVLNAWRYIERLIDQLDPAYDPADADFS